MSTHPTLSTGRAIVKVVKRCDKAKEDERLDLSRCLLAKVPDAIFLLMKHTTLTSCDLSRNTLRRLPPKLGIKFTNLRELYLQGNKLDNLPDDLKLMTCLKSIDISENNFSVLPRVVFKLAALRFINAEGNRIRDVTVEPFRDLPLLQELNLGHNPLTDRSRRDLSQDLSFNVVMETEESDSEDNERGSTESSSPR